MKENQRKREEGRGVMREAMKDKRIHLLIRLLNTTAIDGDRKCESAHLRVVVELQA